MNWIRLEDQRPAWGMACWVLLVNGPGLYGQWGPRWFAVWGVDGRDRWTVLTPERCTMQLHTARPRDLWQPVEAPVMPTPTRA